jgi:TRAP-type transport system small permease protein
MRSVRRYLAQGLEGLALAMAVLASLAMVGIVAIIVTGVVMRRFFNTPLHITEDVVGLMLSAVLFLGLPLVTLRSQHVRVSIVADALEVRFGTALRIAAMLVGVTFFGWILFESIPWFEFAWKRGLKTETARLLLYPWMAVLPLSVGLTFVIYLARLLGLLDAERHGSLEDLTPIAPVKKDG